MSSSAKQAVARQTEEANRTRAASRTTAKAEDSRFATIDANTFYQIITDEAVSPEQKQVAITKALAFTGSKEESRQRIKEFEEFKEFLQERREAMNKEIIRLTDTDAFAELQSVYNEMNTALIDFDAKMKPLTDIIQAIHTLRTNGLTFDTFKEIQADREFEEENARQTTEKTTQRDLIEDEMLDLQRANTALAEQKSFFGFGGVKEEARVQIALNQKKIEELTSRRTSLDSEVASLVAARSARTAKTGQYAQEKAKLRELLDLTGDEHRERQTELVKAALHFVETSKARIGSVREHLGGMNEQIDNLFDANQYISRTYAVLGEGLNEAEKVNQSLRAGFEAPAGEESLIAKHNREEKRTAIEQHMSSLNDAKQDTMTTFADLTGQTIRIKTMMEANQAQVSRVKTMQSQGVAGVADRLATVLQAVSSAALGESSAAARDTLALMAESTNAIARNQTIANAMGVSDANKDILRALEDLGSWGETINTASEITREGVSEARGYLEQLRDLAEEVRGDIGKAFAVHAEAALEQPKQAAPKAASKSPFGI